MAGSSKDSSWKSCDAKYHTKLYGKSAKLATAQVTETEPSTAPASPVSFGKNIAQTVPKIDNSSVASAANTTSLVTTFSPYTKHAAVSADDLCEIPYEQELYPAQTQPVRFS